MRADLGISLVPCAARDTSVTGLYRCRHIDLLRVTSAACRRPAA